MPRTKLVSVWHVEFSHGGQPEVRVCETYEEALRLKGNRQEGCWCVTITGPHQHRVAT